MGDKLHISNTVKCHTFSPSLRAAVNAKALPKGCTGREAASFRLLSSCQGAARLALLLAAAAALLGPPRSASILPRALLLLCTCTQACLSLVSSCLSLITITSFIHILHCSIDTPVHLITKHSGCQHVKDTALAALLLPCAAPSRGVGHYLCCASSCCSI